MEQIGSLLLQASSQWSKTDFDLGNNASIKGRFDDRRLLQSRQRSACFKSKISSYTTNFERREGIDFDTYLTLKIRPPTQAQIQAAAKIQAAWRGFLSRSERKVLDEAATKIQAMVRGFLDRRRYKKELVAYAERKRQKFLNNSATKIQAWWKGIRYRKHVFSFRRFKAIKENDEDMSRLIKIQARSRGILSRRKKFDFERYKDIKGKNEALNRQIERINEMERALLKSLDPRESNEGGFEYVFLKQSSLSLNEVSVANKSVQAVQADGQWVSPMISLSNLSPSLEQFIINKLPEVVDEMSESRIAELYAYLASLETGMKTENELEKLVKKVGGIQNLSSNDLRKLEESRRSQRERAEAILGLARVGLMSNRSFQKEFRQRQEVDEMFPPMPCRSDIVHPDPRKVKALKDAIRLFRQQSKAKEKRELQRMHVLLRTRACPGVYSDICSTELTEFERKLKSVKYWKAKRDIIPPPRPVKRRNVGKKNSKRLKRLFAHALRISSSNKTDQVKQQKDIDNQKHTTAKDGSGDANCKASWEPSGQELRLDKRPKEETNINSTTSNSNFNCSHDE